MCLRNVSTVKLDQCWITPTTLPFGLRSFYFDLESSFKKNTCLLSKLGYNQGPFSDTSYQGYFEPLIFRTSFTGINFLMPWEVLCTRNITR